MPDTTQPGALEHVRARPPEVVIAVPISNDLHKEGLPQIMSAASGLSAGFACRSLTVTMRIHHGDSLPAAKFPQMLSHRLTLCASLSAWSEPLLLVRPPPTSHRRCKPAWVSWSLWGAVGLAESD